MSKLDLTDTYRAALTQDRALHTDDQGREILVGLTHEESVWYLDYQKRSIEGRRTGRKPSKEERRRFLDLAERHNRHRLEMVGAVHQSKLDPQRH